MVCICAYQIFFCVMIIMCRISNGLIFLWIWCHLTRSTCTHYINKRLNENSFIILNRTRFAIQKLRGRKFKWLKSIKRLLIMRRMWICINIGALFSFHHWKMEQWKASNEQDHTCAREGSISSPDTSISSPGHRNYMLDGYGIRWLLELAVGNPISQKRYQFSKFGSYSRTIQFSVPPWSSMNFPPSISNQLTIPFIYRHINI